MSRQLGARLLVLVVAAAPAALTACEIACAARDSHSQAAAHSCHGTQPSGPPHIDAGVQLCGHDEDLPAAASQTAPVSVLAVAVPSPSIVSSLDDALYRVTVVISSPPGHLKRPTSLRL